MVLIYSMQKGAATQPPSPISPWDEGGRGWSLTRSDLIPSCIYMAAELAQRVYNMEENLVMGWHEDKKGLKQFDKLTATQLWKS